MLVPDKEALARLTSPSNLINRLRNGAYSGQSNGAKRTKAMGLFVPSEARREQEKSTNSAQETPAFTAEWNPFTSEDKGTEVEISLRERLNSISSAPQALVPSAANNLLNNSAPITADDILTNADGKIRIVQAHDDALSVLTKALTALSSKIDDVKPDKLPQIISAAMKTVESIRKEKMELLKEQQGREVHFHFYEPARRKITDYEVIDVG